MLKKSKKFRKYKEYWSCNHPRHSGHLTEAVAQKCINNYDPESYKIRTLTLAKGKDRNLYMTECILNGATLKSQAIANNISIERVRQIYARYIRNARCVAARNNITLNQDSLDLESTRANAQQWIMLLAQWANQ